MKRSALQLKVFHALLLVALLVSAGSRTEATSLSTQAENGDGFIAASKASSRNYLLTTRSGQRVAHNAAKHDQFRHSLKQSPLAPAKFAFGQPTRRLYFSASSFAAYDFLRLSACGGRDPPTAS
ncbi:MAG TPA: hypothetical protein VLL54_00160 [Pyrinomonadaceae bacterium]|nr:hypothetical protein [Pyrinomonadaceae bacterium]